MAKETTPESDDPPWEEAPADKIGGASSAAPSRPAGTSAHIEPQVGGHSFWAMIDGEAQSPIDLPEGHRLIKVIHETIRRMHADALWAITPRPEPGPQPDAAVGRRAPPPVLSAAERRFMVKPAKPGQQPTPAQAAMSPPRPVSADGQPIQPPSGRSRR